MTETSVEDKICRHCGSDVRPNSQFCYHCGGSLAPRAENESSFEKTSDQSKNGDFPPSPVKIVPEETGSEKVSEASSETEASPTLKSAASMRRKPKTQQLKQTEIIWEEHENAPNLWFVSAAILLSLLVGAIFYLAAYLQ